MPEFHQIEEALHLTWDGLQYRGTCPVCRGDLVTVKVYGPDEFGINCPTRGCTPGKILSAVAALSRNGQAPSETPSRHEEKGDKGDRSSVRPVLSPFYPLLSFEELCALPPPKYQIEDFFMEQSIVQFYGETNHGKSLLCWDLACSVCLGSETWFGRQIHIHGPAVWINADGGRGLILRAQAWREANGGEFNNPLLTLMGSVHLNKAQQMGQFREQILAMEERPCLVFFDTQSRCCPGARENDADEMTLVMDGLHRLKMDAACTVCLIHHANVSGERERGSGVPKNDCDTQIRVSKDAGSGIFTVHCNKGRDHPEFRDFYFKTKPVLDSVVIVQHDSGPPKDTHAEKMDRQHELTLLVRDQPGVTYAEAAEELGLSEKSVKRYAEDLVALKVIIRNELPKLDSSPGSPRTGLFLNPGTLNQRDER